MTTNLICIALILLVAFATYRLWRVSQTKKSGPLDLPPNEFANAAFQRIVLPAVAGKRDRLMPPIMGAIGDGGLVVQWGIEQMFVRLYLTGRADDKQALLVGAVNGRSFETEEPTARDLREYLNMMEEFVWGGSN